jgi:hypothetical protein
MTPIIAALMGFIILTCFTNTKSLIAIIGLAALFYVSLPAFFRPAADLGSRLLLFQIKEQHHV